VETVRPLLIKYIYIAAITIIFLTYLQVPSVALGTSLILAVFVTLALYFAGDRFLLPRFGTVASAIANFVIAAVILSLSNAFVREPITTGAILASAAVIGVAEWFFFRYARSEVTPAMEGGDVTSFSEFLGEPLGHEGENQGQGDNHHVEEQHEQHEHHEHQEQPENEG
jgi:ABC-type nickel/cobalt efflux system permease component RcnA